MKTQVYFILIVVFCLSCNKQSETKESPFLTTEKKRAYTSILKQYQMPNLESIEGAEYLANDNSVLTLSIQYINEGKAKELMILLDENKKEIYSLPSNNVFSLMGEFNDMLLELYKKYLPKSEIVTKEIELRRNRALFFETYIALQEMQGYTIDDYFEHVKLYTMETFALMALYKEIGDTEKAKECERTLRQIAEDLKQP